LEVTGQEMYSSSTIRRPSIYKSDMPDDVPVYGADGIQDDKGRPNLYPPGSPLGKSLKLRRRFL